MGTTVTENENLGKKEKSPAFQFYPKDWCNSETIRGMSLEEQGAYIQALSVCWLEGSIPADPKKLAKVIGYNCSEETATNVQLAFKVSSTDPSRLVHQRLERELEKQGKWKLKCSKAGQKSGEVRKAHAISRLYESKVSSTRLELNANIPISRSLIPNSINKISNRVLVDTTIKDAEQSDIPENGHLVLNLEVSEDQKLAESKLCQPTGAEAWEKSSIWLTAARRPLKKFPNIFLSTPELIDIIRQYRESGIESKMRDACQLIDAKLNSMRAEGKDTERVSCAVWFMGWVKNQILENAVKQKRLEQVNSYEIRK